MSTNRRVAVVATAFAASALVTAACGSQPEPPRTAGGQGPIAVGAQAPDFQLPSAQGGEVALADFREKRPVLLFFSMGPG